MFCIFLLLFLASLVFCDFDDLDDFEEWNIIDLTCRDDFSRTVDWWVMYKPPKGNTVWESGLNYVYITSKEAGTWRSSDILINGKSMLKNTLSPMYRRTYNDHLAKLTYSSKETTNGQFGSIANGVMVVDEIGGVWISHTLPNLPDVEDDSIEIPLNEINKGHLLVCLSANLPTLNKIVKSLVQAETIVMRPDIPRHFAEFLPDWVSIQSIINKKNDYLLPSINFLTLGKTAEVQVMVRKPGETRCLYNTFAKRQQIVLDVYGHDLRTPTVCEDFYSVRNIDMISLKFPFAVFYINNKTDHASFAVSTGGPWQRTGSNRHDYWVCFGSSEGEDASKKGGILLCLENYLMWRSFDVLKVKDPVC